MNDEWLRASYRELLYAAARLSAALLQEAQIKVTGTERRGDQVFLLIRKGENEGGFSLDRVVDETLFLNGGDRTTGFDPRLQSWEDILEKMARVTDVRVSIVDAMLQCKTPEEAMALVGQINASGTVQLKLRPFEDSSAKRYRDLQDDRASLEKPARTSRRDIV